MSPKSAISRNHSTDLYLSVYEKPCDFEEMQESDAKICGSSPRVRHWRLKLAPILTPLPAYWFKDSTELSLRSNTSIKLNPVRRI